MQSNRTTNGYRLLYEYLDEIQPVGPAPHPRFRVAALTPAIYGPVAFDIGTYVPQNIRQVTTLDEEVRPTRPRRFFEDPVGDSIGDSAGLPYPDGGLPYGEGAFPLPDGAFPFPDGTLPGGADDGLPLGEVAPQPGDDWHYIVVQVVSGSGGSDGTYTLESPTQASYPGPNTTLPSALCSDGMGNEVTAVRIHPFTSGTPGDGTYLWRTSAPATGVPFFVETVDAQTSEFVGTRPPQPPETPTITTSWFVVRA